MQQFSCSLKEIYFNVSFPHNYVVIWWKKKAFPNVTKLEFISSFLGDKSQHSGRDFFFVQFTYTKANCHDLNYIINTCWCILGHTFKHKDVHVWNHKKIHHDIRKISADLQKSNSSLVIISTSLKILCSYCMFSQKHQETSRKHCGKHAFWCKMCKWRMKHLAKMLSETRKKESLFTPPKPP